MKYEFNLQRDRITSLSAPGYTDREIGVFLSKAEEVFIRGGYSPYRDFEQTEERKKDFDELKSFASITTSSSTQTGVHTNGTFFDLPSDFLYTLQEEIVIASDDDCYNGNIVEVVPTTEDEYNRNKNNPFKRPSTDKAWRMEGSRVTPGDSELKRHEVITDGNYTISQYDVRYIRRTNGITPYTKDGTTTAQVDCELDQSTHREIVDIAVRMATASTSPEEYQIAVSEETKNIT